MKKLKDLNFKGKRVLVRADFNVPLSPKGDILDDFRIKATLPTIEYLIKEKAKVILMSHLDDPKGQVVESLRLTPIKDKLKEYLNLPVFKTRDCLGREVKDLIEKMKPGEILLLENLRFHQEEEENEENFSRELSRLADSYINDAFGACHRKHASIVGVPEYLPSAMGFLLEKEIKVLSQISEKPVHPLVAIIGGAKISTKIKVIEQFLKKADHLLLGGQIANTVLEAKGIIVKEELIDPEILEKIKKIELTNPKLHLPIDGIISLKDLKTGLEEKYLRKGSLGTVKKEEGVYDIGPETIKIFSDIIKEAKTIVWNGPLGLYEEAQFEKGTKLITQAILKNRSAFKVVGGGDTDAFLTKYNLKDKFNHVSSGGGAMLDFLAGETLPGIAALEKSEPRSVKLSGKL